MTKALKVITVSEFSKKECIEYFQIPEEKIEVIYGGVSERFKPLNVNILTVGTLKLTKNLKRILNAHRLLLQRGYEIELYVVGKQPRFLPP